MILALLLLLSGAPTCDESGGPWLLVYRYTFHDDSGAVAVAEVFDGARFPSEEDAYCGAALRRRTGVALPTLERYGRDSNVVPETITPMPSLQAERLGIASAH